MRSKSFYFLFYTISVLLVTSLIISCRKENKTTEKAPNKKPDTSKKTSETSNTQNTTTGSSSGKELFYMKSKENNIACADCHSDGTNTNNPLTKYFSDIKGANKRTSTFLGKFTGEEVAKNAGGATLCWEAYMKMKTPLTENQIKDLNEYYASVATANSPAEIKYETIALPTRDKSKLKDIQKIVLELKGDPSKGEELFKRSCGFCHGENSTIKKVPSLFEDFEGNIKSITYNVRLGDGAMPFFKMNSYSNQDIADVGAFIMQKNEK